MLHVEWHLIQLSAVGDSQTPNAAKYALSISQLPVTLPTGKLLEINCYYWVSDHQPDFKLHDLCLGKSNAPTEFL